MSKLVEDRKNRINYMLSETESDTKIGISYFEDVLPNNPNMNPKQLFGDCIWINIEKFLAKMGKHTGLRDRVLNEYFDILKNCGDLEINRQNSHYFRNSEVVRQYLAKHPELA